MALLAWQNQICSRIATASDSNHEQQPLNLIDPLV